MKILEKILKNRAYLTIALSVSIFSFILLLSIGPKFFYASNKIWQTLIVNYFHTNNASKDIVMVEIDEKTVSKLWRFPFDRTAYIPVIERLNNSWAAIIAFDVIFPDKSNAESDIKFWEAITKAKNIIFGLSFSSSGNKYIEQPLDVLSKNLLWKGISSPIVDPITNVSYWYKPYYRDKKEWIIYEFFPVVIAKKFLGIDSPSISKKYSYDLDNFTSLPYINKNKHLVYVNQLWVNNYSRISFYDLYDENEFERVKKQIDLKGKIIIIWATAKALDDTIYTTMWEMYWVYYHANALSMILEWRGIKFVPIFVERTLLFLVLLISIYFNLSRSGRILLLSNICIVTFFWMFFPIFTAVYADMIVNNIYELIIALIFWLALSNIFKYMIENKHKNKLNKALWEYVSKDIAAEILSWSWKINLDGEQKKIAMFFSDIEWFTSISEKFTPEDLVKFLREYLSSMSNIILDERGFINKYEWDAIMALWWVFWPQIGKDTHDACESALKQQETLDKLNIKWEREWFTEIKARIGIHVGSAIIWNIWAEWRKMEFTALGDNVNLASRLEWVNKFYWTYICVSEDVVKETREDFSYRYLDKIRVKWKEQPVVIYELLSRKGCLGEKKKEIILKFTQWIKEYLAWDFTKAAKIFDDCVEKWDSPSITYLDRSKKYIIKWPWDNWDGVWNHDEK
jgi:adenylate cyclase